MTLTLYNTLTRRKETFQPIDPANVRMYVCGPTVYDYAHIGNARPIIVFDLLFRLLRHLAAKGEWDGGKGETIVTYARNITDVDDKINARAVERYPDLPPTEAIRKLTTETTEQFHKDIAALGVLPPTAEPRATEYIRRSDNKEDMVRLIEALVGRGHAYVAEEHVLFDVGSMSDYGRLSNRSLDEMEAGARVDVAPFKRGPMDFVLWKPSGPSQPAWPSPMGIETPGRPGWHIECSAMAGALLGDVFDIHGGGIDLVFPHHENELAQSRCAHGTPAMAKVWMHNGFLQVEGEKMSKSLGNFVTINDLLQEWTGRVVRFAMLQTHYRQPINWTANRLEESRWEIGEWAAMYPGSEAEDDYQKRRFLKVPPSPSKELVDVLSDDMNTPGVIALLREQFSSQITSGLSKEFFQNCEFLGVLDAEKIHAFWGNEVSGSVRPDLLFAGMPHVFRIRAGFANGVPQVVERGTHALNNLGVEPKISIDGFVELVPRTAAAAIDQKRIDGLIAARSAARKAKDFKESDRIRDELAAMGIQLKDAKDPATGEIVTTWEVRAAATADARASGTADAHASGTTDAHASGTTDVRASRPTEVKR